MLAFIHIIVCEVSAMKNCLIIAGGDYAPIKPQPGDYIIACDRGYAYALRENIRPHLLMGDFDSYSGTLPVDIPVERFKKEKDDTDTMLAIRKAIELGFDSVRLCCAMGGRLDHLYANIQSLAFGLKAGLRISMEDENSFVTMLSPGEHCLEKRDGFSLSLFAFSQRVENISIRGAKYELEKGNLENSFPLGASNEFRDDVHISFERGQLLVVCSRLEG